MVLMKKFLAILCIAGLLAPQVQATVGNNLDVNDPGAAFQFQLRPNIQSGGDVTWLNTGGTILPTADLPSVNGGVTFDVSGASASVTLDGAARNLTLNGAVTFKTSAGNGLTINEIIKDGVATGSVVKTGNGTLVLGNANNSYSGGTTINGGAVSISVDADLGAVGTGGGQGGGTGGVTFGGGTLSLTAPGIITQRNLILNAGGGSINLNGNTATQGTLGIVSGTGALTVFGGAGSVLNLNGANTYTGGTVMNLATVNAANPSALGTGALSLINGTAQFSFAGNIATNVTLNAGGGTIDPQANNVSLSGVISGAGGLTKIGAGILLLSGVNTYLNGTVLNQGTININNNSALGTGSLTFSNANNNDTLQAGANLTNVANAINLNSTGGDNFDTLASTMTLSGVISGGNNLTKIGSGGLALSGANTYTGNTALNNGTITIYNNSALGNGGSLIFGANNTTLQAGANLANVGNNIAVNFNGTIDTSTNSLSLTGAITGPGALTKTGTGVLTLVTNAGTNFSTGLTIGQGTVNVSANAELGTSNALALGGAVSSGTLQFATGLGFNTGRTITLNAGGGAIDTNGNNVTLSGVITGTGALAKTGNGVLTLTNGGNNFSNAAGLTIAQGTINAQLDSYLGAAANLLALGSATTNGTLQFVNGTNVSTTRNMSLNAGGGTVDVNGTASGISGNVTGGGGLTVTSTANSSLGAFTLSGANNTFSGGITIFGSTVVAVTQGAANAFGTGGLTFDATATGASKFDFGGFGRTVTSLSAASAANIVDLHGAQLTINNTAANLFAGKIADTGGGGTIVKNGTGVLTFNNAANAYTGGTMVNAGILNFNSDAALGVGGLLTLNGGALQFGGIFTSTHAVTLGAGGGTIDTNGNNATLSGAITGTGTLTKIGAGVLTLTGGAANTFSNGAGLTIAQGTVNVSSDTNLGASTNLQLGGAATNGTLQYGAAFNTARNVTLNAGGGTIDLNGNNATLSGNITGTGVLTLANSGAGATLTLSGGAGSTYNGGTLINNGILNYGSATGLGTGAVTFNAAGTTLQAGGAFNPTNAVNMANAGTINDGGFATTLSGNITGTGVLTKAGVGTLTLSGGAGSTYSGGTLINNGTLNYGSATGLGTGAVTFNAANTTLQAGGAFNPTNAINMANAGTIDTGIFNTTLSGAITGGGALTKIGTGVLTLTGGAANTFSNAAGLTISQGMVNVSSDTNLGGSNALALGGGATRGTLQYGASFTTARNVTLNAGGGTVDVNGTASGISGNVTGGGGLTVTSSNGAGTLTLSGANNTFTGGITIAQNLAANTVTVTQGVANAFGTGGLTFDATATGASKFDLGGFGRTVTSLSAASAANIVDLHGAQLTINNTAANLFAGNIADTGGGGTIVKNGTGVLTFNNAANAYTGGTTVNAGTLNINSDGALGAAAGGLTLAGGTLQMGANGISSARGITLGAGGGTIDTNGNNATLSGVISGANPLNKIGLGTLTLTGNSTYGGATSINAGTLALGVNGALPLAQALTIANAGTFDMQTFTQTANSLTTNAGTVKTVWAKGATALTVTGNANIAGGTLVVAAPSSGIISPGDTFIPLHWNGTRTGTFAVINTPATFNVTTSYGPTGAAGDLTLTEFIVPTANLATTPNQIALGPSFDVIRNGASDQSLLQTFNSLPANQIPAALDQMTPTAVGGAIAGAATAGAGAASAGVGARLVALNSGTERRGFADLYYANKESPLQGPLYASAGAADVEPREAGSPWGFFVSGLGTTGLQGSITANNGTQPGYSFNSGGFMAGTDYRFNDTYIAGINAGYVRSNALIGSPGSGSIESNSARLGFYGVGNWDALHVNASVGGASDSLQVSRGISFGGLIRAAVSAPSATELYLGSQVSYDLRLGEHGRATPFYGLTYNRMMMKGYTETNAGALNLTIGSVNSDSLLQDLGVRLALKQGGIVPYVSLGYRRELIDQSRTITAAFQTAGSPFSVKTVGPSRDGLVAGAGAEMGLSENLSLNLAANADWRTQYRSGDFTGTFRYRFDWPQSHFRAHAEPARGPSVAAAAPIAEPEGAVDRHFAKAGAFLAANDPESAKAELTAAGKYLGQEDQRRVFFFDQMGLANLMQKDYAQAKDSFIAAINLGVNLGMTGPVLAESYAGMGHCLAHENSAHNAIAYYRKALDTGPSPKLTKFIKDKLRELGDAP